MTPLAFMHAAYLAGAGPPQPPASPLDLLIVGAGLSGSGAAVHLQRDCPKKPSRCWRRGRG